MAAVSSSTISAVIGESTQGILVVVSSIWWTTTVVTPVSLHLSATFLSVFDFLRSTSYILRRMQDGRETKMDMRRAQWRKQIRNF